MRPHASPDAYDWSSYRSFTGTAAGLPASVRLLLRARTEAEADAAERGIDNVALVQGRRRMSAELAFFTAELTEHGNPSCVDILLMCAVHDETTRDTVAEVLRAALHLPSCTRITDLIEASLADLP